MPTVSTEISTEISASYLGFIVEQLPETLQNDPRLYAAAEIKPEDINVAGIRIPFDNYRRFISAAIKVAGDESIILRATANYRIALHGPITLAFLSSANALEGLKILREFISLSMPYCVFTITQYDGVCNLEVELDRRSGEEYRVMIESILVCIQGLLKEVLSEKIHWATVEVDYPAPEYVDIYAEFYHCPVRFNANKTRIKFPLEKLLEPIGSANEAIRAMAQRACRQQLKDYKSQSLNSWRKRVRTVIDENAVQRMTLSQVAGILNVSPRTLQRHLSDEDVTFQVIQDERARDLAEIYLGFEKISVEKVALLLGYSSTANLRRSFRRWFGVTPQQYRERILMSQSE
jgi:AraC-like DNA-binding protein